MGTELKEEVFRIKGNDGKDVFVYCWDGVEKPRAVVQIFHGMAEHAGRYRRLAEYLNTNGIIVYADDHRGHGKTAESVEELGYIGKDGFNRILEDECILTGEISAKHPGLPVFVLGHSFGSFVAQNYIARYGKNIAGLILSGSSMMKGPEVRAGLMIAAAQKMFLGERRKSGLLNKLGFGSYNRKIPDAQSPFAWLSRDEAEVRKYMDDPLCGSVFPSNFFYHFFKGMLKAYDTERIMKIPKKLPIFVVSGNDDPVGNYGVNVEKLYGMYKGLDLTDVEMKLYPGARHEILNETNRDEVSADILAWIEKHISR